MAIKPLVEAAIFALSGLVVALALSWLLLAQFDFSYGFWHDHAGISSAIERYAPNNRYRQGFHLTTREQRVELFAGINRAIHEHGEGLSALSYEVPGFPEQTLLREPEIVHLTDVANLIDACRVIVLVIGLIWLGLWIYYWASRRSPPVLRLQLLGTLGFAGLLTLVVLLLGPVKVFYDLHILLFPKDHQWFFFYEESLMSTLMWAPNLFGWIAVEWALLALIFFVGLQVGTAKVVERMLGNKKGAAAPSQSGNKKRRT
jgi:hypothetical protein